MNIRTIYVTKYSNPITYYEIDIDSRNNVLAVFVPGNVSRKERYVDPNQLQGKILVGDIFCYHIVLDGKLYQITDADAFKLIMTKMDLTHFKTIESVTRIVGLL